MNDKHTEDLVSAAWDDSIVPQLCDYIRIPNKSPHFDADWEQNGYMEAATQQTEGARVIAESSANLSDGAQNQAASVEEMTASVEVWVSNCQPRICSPQL